MDPRRQARPRRDQHHQRGPHHAALKALAITGDLSSWDSSGIDQVLWLGTGAVGRVGLWEGHVAKALFADEPKIVPSGPPTCPNHPTFLSRSGPGIDLTIMEVPEHSVVFFVGLVHQFKITSGDNVDAEQEIHFAIAGVAHPPPPPGPPDHAAAPGQHCPSVAEPRGHARWSMVHCLPV